MNNHLIECYISHRLRQMHYPSETIFCSLDDDSVQGVAFNGVFASNQLITAAKRLLLNSPNLLNSTLKAIDNGAGIALRHFNDGPAHRFRNTSIDLKYMFSLSNEEFRAFVEFKDLLVREMCDYTHQLLDECQQIKTAGLHDAYYADDRDIEMKAQEIISAFDSKLVA